MLTVRGRKLVAKLLRTEHLGAARQNAGARRSGSSQRGRIICGRHSEPIDFAIEQVARCGRADRLLLLQSVQDSIGPQVGPVQRPLSEFVPEAGRIAAAVVVVVPGGAQGARRSLSRGRLNVETAAAAAAGGHLGAIRRRLLHAPDRFGDLQVVLLLLLLSSPQSLLLIIKIRTVPNLVGCVCGGRRRCVGGGWLLECEIICFAHGAGVHHLVVAAVYI